jgi:hypothetical protein
VVEVVEGLDAAGLQADQLGLGAGVLDRVARAGQLDLLDAVGGQDRDPLAVQLLRPRGAPFAWFG